MDSFKVNRAELLKSLEAVQPGLSPKDIVEQSASFVFTEDGLVTTFNDELAVRRKSSLPKGFRAAVTAAPLLAILRKLPDDDLEVEEAEGELIFSGKKRKAGIRMDAEIILPIDKVEKPEEWRKLPEDFISAIKVVQDCATKDETHWILTCVHIHPKWLEACDNYQITRFKLKTGFEKPCLVRRDAIKHVTMLEMTEISETPHWFHFRNGTGLTLSCKRHMEEYPDTSGILSQDGNDWYPAKLPRGLADAVERSEIFSAEDADNNVVQVELFPSGKARIKAIGNTGWYQEVKSIEYSGAQLNFRIAPNMLVKIVKEHNDCLVSADKIRVNGGKFTFVSCLSNNEEPKKEKE